jgi:hypothetical protein
MSMIRMIAIGSSVSRSNPMDIKPPVNVVLKVRFFVEKQIKSVKGNRDGWTVKQVRDKKTALEGRFFIVNYTILEF